MKITVFTGNQPRHLSLIGSLSEIADEVFVLQESATLFPGATEDFYRKSDVMKRYFSEMMRAEKEVFGEPRFSAENVRQLVMRIGDLNSLTVEQLAPALQSDLYVVFGASYIKGPLCDFLVQQSAYNIHMGVSPYFRGNSCNFWAQYDGHPEYVGATIHMLTKGLDTGPMLFHALPEAATVDRFVFGMLAVKSAHQGFIQAAKSGALKNLEPQKQDKEGEIRYSKKKDFTDEVAAEFLDAPFSPEEFQAKIDGREQGQYLRPYIPGQWNPFKF